MDNRLIFLYHVRAFDEAVTQKDRQSGEMVDSVQAVRLVFSEARISRLGCDGDRTMSREAVEFTLTRKAAKEQIRARTANRHR